MPTATLSREAIFAIGLKDANGTVLNYDKDRNYGFVRLNGEIEIELFFLSLGMTKKERREIIPGSQVLFDMAPGQLDQKKPRPRVANPRLITPPEANYSR